MATVKTEPLTRRYYCWECVRVFHLVAIPWTQENVKPSADEWYAKAEIKKCPVCGGTVYSLG